MGMNLRAVEGIRQNRRAALDGQPGAAVSTWHLLKAES